MSKVKVAGAWKTPSVVKVKVAGSWKTVSVVKVKVAGSWKTTTLGGAPAPVITYISAGVFEVSNTIAGVYTATLISGSGTATPSTVLGKQRYTLSAADARFSVTFAYAAGAPVSQPDYMERKAYTYSGRTVPQTCYSSCNCHLVGSNCWCTPGPCAGGCSSNGQCGCGGANPCMCGTIGTVVCDSCPYDCSYTVYDVLIDQPGYTNGGAEWYKVA